MHFAVLGFPTSWYLRDLRRALAAGERITQVSFRDLAAAAGRVPERARVGTLATPLDGVDAVIVRTMPPGSLEQVVFRMDALARLERMGVAVVNPARAIEAAVDKYLATIRLEEAGFDVPRTICCQTADDALRAFEALGRDVVLKPLFGAEGRGIARLNDPDLALRAFKLLESLGAVLYLQEFIPHEGCDLRLLVVGEQVVGIRRRNPLDWRTNVSRGAAAEPLAVDASLERLAQRAAAAVGASVAGVDLLPGRDGRLYALEVNAVPGWQGLAKALNLDVARLVLDHVAALAAARQSAPGASRADTEVERP